MMATLGAHFCGISRLWHAVDHEKLLYLGNIYEINKDLLRKELDELKSENIRLNSESRFMKQVENLNKDLLRKGINFKSENSRLKSENDSLKKQIAFNTRFRDVKSGN